MTLKQLQYVLEIARCGKISQASENLYVAQPYLSSTLRDLESELGITIFRRSRHGSVLTEDGREFLIYAKQLLDQHDRIKEMYPHKKESPPLRFSLATQRYSFAVKAFFDCFDDADKYEIHINEMDMYDVINSVFEHKSDVGVIFLSDSTEKFFKKYLSVKGLIFTEIVAVRPKAIFRKGHPLASHDEVDINELAKYPYLTFELGTPSVDFSDEVLLQTPSLSKKHFYVNDRATLINVTSHTDAYTLGTGVLSEGFAGENNTSRPIKGFGRIVKIGWIRSKDVPLSEMAERFIERLGQTLTDDQA